MRPPCLLPALLTPTAACLALQELAEAWACEQRLHAACRSALNPAIRPHLDPALTSVATSADCPPQQLKAQLADPATRPAAMELVKALQRHLSQFCGLMAVVFPAPGTALEVRDLGDGPLSPAQAAALQQRAMR